MCKYVFNLIILISSYIEVFAVFVVVGLLASILEGQFIGQLRMYCICIGRWMMFRPLHQLKWFLRSYAWHIRVGLQWKWTGVRCLMRSQLGGSPVAIVALWSIWWSRLRRILWSAYQYNFVWHLYRVCLQWFLSRLMYNQSRFACDNLEYKETTRHWAHHHIVLCVKIMGSG